MPQCSAILVDSEHVIAEICHIRGRRKAAARFDATMQPKERDGFSNLILLCPTCHTLIDKDRTTYTIDSLIKIKAEHERQSSLKLTPEIAAQALKIFINSKSPTASHHMFNSFFSTLAISRIRKEIEQSQPPAVQSFQLPKDSMFYGGDVWHLVRRYNSRNIGGTNSPFTWLRHLVIEAELGTVSFPITRLDGLNANNTDYGHIRRFALENFRHDYNGGRGIRFQTDDDFKENIGCFNRHIGQPAYISWCEWSGRFYLRNGGTGHHTAAIYRQCIDQGREFVFKAKLQTERLNTNIIEKLQPYLLVLCEKDTALKIYDWSYKCDAEESWLCYDFPYEWSDCYKPSLQLIALPRSSRLCPYVMAWLNRTPNSYFDFSKILNSYQPKVLADNIGHGPRAN